MLFDSGQRLLDTARDKSRGKPLGRCGCLRRDLADSSALIIHINDEPILRLERSSTEHAQTRYTVLATRFTRKINARLQEYLRPDSPVPKIMIFSWQSIPRFACANTMFGAPTCSLQSQAARDAAWCPPAMATGLVFESTRDGQIVCRTPELSRASRLVVDRARAKVVRSNLEPIRTLAMTMAKLQALTVGDVRSAKSTGVGLAQLVRRRKSLSNPVAQTVVDLFASVSKPGDWGNLAQDDPIPAQQQLVKRVLRRLRVQAYRESGVFIEEPISFEHVFLESR